MKSASFLIVVLSLLAACQLVEPEQKGAFKFVETPAKEGGEPNLLVTSSGKLILSWVEYLNDTTDALLHADLVNGEWSAPRQIASGADWFVNWADFPMMTSYLDDDQSLAANWLAKSAEGAYDYDIHIAQSKDGGRSWSDFFKPHTDGIAAEHGFLSMMPYTKDRLLAVWLDGRLTKTGAAGEDAHGHGHHGGGPMTLRAAAFDRAGELYEEVELDNRVCDCCQTDIAMTSEGPVVAYRDRSEQEIRDMSIVRLVDGQWTKPKTIYADAWKTSACPVNGPALAAMEQSLAVVWFSAANTDGMVNVVFSNDAGASFGRAIRIDEGRPLGRVDVVLLEKGRALVSWLEQEAEGASIRLVEVFEDGRKGLSKVLTQTAASRQSGFPIMVRSGGAVWLAWTKSGLKSGVATAVYQPKME